MHARLEPLSGLPLDDDGPVFAEPWQAQAFAMTLKLHEAGAFTWREWADCLSQEIERARRGGDPDRGDTYYHHWLRALERIVAAKGLASDAELSARKAAWDKAARHTEHGKPIVLQNTDLDWYDDSAGNANPTA